MIIMFHRIDPDRYLEGNGPHTVYDKDNTYYRQAFHLRIAIVQIVQFNGAIIMSIVVRARC